VLIRSFRRNRILESLEVPLDEELLRSLELEHATDVLYELGVSLPL
jgi:hypothetical protein